MSKMRSTQDQKTHFNQWIFLLISLLVCDTSAAHCTAEVPLHQALSVQLGPEAPAELHQLFSGQTRSQSLVLLHHGPAGVLQDQQAHVPE